MRVDELMSRSVVTVSPDTPLKDVAACLVEHGISGVPVVESGSLVGVISESDIVLKENASSEERLHLLARVRKRKRSGLAEAATAREVMGSPPITVGPRTSAAGAAWLMVENNVNRLPVVESGRVVGIISRADLVRAFARSDAEIRREICEELLPSLSLSPAEVDVTVEGGQVTLGGELERPSDVKDLPPAVAGIVGVVRVSSELRVKTPGECIYAIRDAAYLESRLEAGGSGAFQEIGETWALADKLLVVARRDGRSLPIVFAGAEDYEPVRWAAVITEIEVDEGDPASGRQPSSDITFRELRRIDPAHPVSSLHAASTGHPLPETNRRSYVICQTPGFL